jgi:hypothetical protein
VEAVDWVLIETRLEDRDGAEWVSGLCPFCWERVAFRAPRPGAAEIEQCPNGHPVRIVDLRSEGWAAHAGA